jgi:hypothetical protein
MHMRHPFEQGGSLWLCSVIVGQASCVAAALVYWQYYTGPGKIDAASLFAVIGGLVSLTLVSGVGLCLVMDRAFLHTFFSPKTGWQYAIEGFSAFEGVDSARIRIFRTHPTLWRPIRQEVKEWVLENYDAWNDQPWFTDRFRTMIPEEFLPKRIIAPGQSVAPRMGLQVRVDVNNDPSFHRRTTVFTDPLFP